MSKYLAYLDEEDGSDVLMSVVGDTIQEEVNTTNASMTSSNESSADTANCPGECKFTKCMGRFYKYKYITPYNYQ